jgi:hypothetical protein
MGIRATRTARHVAITVPLATAATATAAFLAVPSSSVPPFVGLVWVVIELGECERADERFHPHSSDRFEEITRGSRRGFGCSLRTGRAHGPGDIARHLGLPVDIGRACRVDASPRSAIGRGMHRARWRRKSAERQWWRDVTAGVAPLSAVEDYLVRSVMDTRPAIESWNHRRLGRIPGKITLVAWDRCKGLVVDLKRERGDRFWFL